jgi:YD repeat-containing protein
VPDVLKAYDPQLHAVAGAAGDAQTEQATTGRTLRARVLTRVGPAVSSLSVDRAGNAYVHDAGAGAVKRIDEAGTISTVAAAGPEVSAVHVAVDGTVYLASRPTAGTPFHHIIRQRPDGQREAVVGAPSGLPDDGPAAQVRLMGPVTFLTTGPTGELYWVERLGQSSCAAPSTGRDRLRELTADGQVVTRMGRPCQATGPPLDWPFELAYAPVPAARQAVGPTRTGWVDFGPIGTVAVAPDGSLVVSHKVVPPGDSLATQLISVIGSDGWLRRRAGGVRWLDDPRGGDGMPLDDPMSRVNLHDDPIALTAEGDILVAEGGGDGYLNWTDVGTLRLSGRVRLLDAETIRTVAGGGSALQDGDALAIRLGGPVPAGEPKGYLCNLWNGQEPGFTLPGFASPTASGPYCPRWLSIATHPAGGFVVLDTRDGGAVVRVAPPHVLAATGAERRVPSRSGDELHLFDPRGRHLRTVKAQGGATVWQFGYDAQGALLTVTDGSGNSTRIERDAQGRPQAVVSPFGLRSTLTVDATGHLQRVTSPLGHVHEAVHGADGLLRSFRVPGGRLATMSYDAAGRLTADQNDADGGWQLARVELPADTQPDPDTVRRTSGHAVTARSAEGRQDTYRSEFLGDGSLRHTTDRRRRLGAFPPPGGRRRRAVAAG